MLLEACRHAPKCVTSGDVTDTGPWALVAAKYKMLLAQKGLTGDYSERTPNACHDRFVHLRSAVTPSGMGEGVEGAHAVQELLDMVGEVVEAANKYNNSGVMASAPSSSAPPTRLPPAAPLFAGAGDGDGDGLDWGGSVGGTGGSASGAAGGGAGVTIPEDWAHNAASSSSGASAAPPASSSSGASAAPRAAVASAAARYRAGVIKPDDVSLTSANQSRGLRMNVGAAVNQLGDIVAQQQEGQSKMVAAASSSIAEAAMVASQAWLQGRALAAEQQARQSERNSAVVSSVVNALAPLINRFAGSAPQSVLPSAGAGAGAPSAEEERLTTANMALAGGRVTPAQWVTAYRRVVDGAVRARMARCALEYKDAAGQPLVSWDDVERAAADSPPRSDK